MKINLSIFILLAITFSACTNMVLDSNYRKLIKQSETEFEKWYGLNGLFNHFPESISNDSIINMLYTIPADMEKYKEHNNYISENYLVLKIKDDILNYYPDSILFKTNYSGDNFIIDLGFRFYTQLDTLKIRNVARPDSYPIPYFEDFDFGFGDEPLTYWDNQGNESVANKYNIPDDLEVYVLKAKNGDFWKVKCDIFRPESLEVWKNGCSSGIAISKKRNIVVYWMMAW